MDMPQFQRLRRIKQLGLISLIYPGATHTRFEHSVGTMNLGSKLSMELGLSDDDVELIRASALLHDIGHGPFSHVSEGVLSVPHEELTKYVVTKTSMRDLLEGNQTRNFSCSQGAMMSLLPKPPTPELARYVPQVDPLTLPLSPDDLGSNPGPCVY